MTGNNKLKQNKKDSSRKPTQKSGKMTDLPCVCQSLAQDATQNYSA